MRTRHKTRYPGIFYRLVDETKPNGDRRYIVWYSDAQGVGHTQTLPVTASLEDARLLQGNLQARKADGETLTRTRKTVGELLDEWFAAQRPTWKPKTAEDYAYGVTVLKDAFGSRRATELSPSDVARLISRLKLDGKKTWTVKKIMSPLNGAYRVAVRDGLVGSNPVEKLLPSERPKGDQREMRCLPQGDIGKLLEATSTKRWKALFALLCFTGLRISEALALTWDDVLEDRVIVRGGKTDSAKREVMLIPSVRRLLVSYRLTQTPGATLVFGTRENRSPGRREALRALRVAEEKASLPNYTLHELRHTFASILISQGEPLTLIARQMGHADPGITLKTYAHLFEEQESVDAAMEKLQTAMGGMV